MDQLTILAASGMRSRIESLELIANNLSNAATAGYKADREFFNLYQSAEANTDSVQPVIERNWIDFSQGLLIETRSPLDVALSGNGFFVVESPNGLLYTRNGSFRVSKKGLLETREGYPVRAAGPDRVIRISPDDPRPIEIKPDGEVTREGQVLGRLQVAGITGPDVVAKHGENYFRLVNPKGLLARSTAEVHQGKIEASNVGPAESAVRLISVLRQFEMLQRAALLGAEMNRRAIEEVARVQG